jgi:hypothetical protein
MKQGHHTILHCFDEIVDAPQGVEIYDANKLMKPREIIKHHKTSSLALASDIYRMRILAEGMGIYVDCDVFALSPFEDSEYIFGWDSCFAWKIEDMSADPHILGLINGAVLKIPVGSDLMNKMLAATENPYFIPPWLSPRKIVRYKLQKSLGFGIPVTKQRWGTIGPIALTHYVRALNLTHHVLAPDIFYFFRPGHHTCLLNDPAFSLREILTPRSKAIHLCSSGGMPQIVVPGSPLHEMLNV